ncbi:protein mono-ADP-ribosyltransferase PARP4 [Sorex fumeus]|uniref:protein mono-ADP-ribosyltransferase PARP4 n=1 Tax=Sorex fumeus TaxID=62283 RepID=UPI0024AC8CE6|nr:protein mono-ADP-ribosyltransferase PARP4 [Sorex fumeus]
MTVGIFANCTFCLKVKHLSRDQKKKLQTDIKENGGNFSLSLNSQCTHVIVDCMDVLSQHFLKSTLKNHMHITSPDFVWESVRERRLLDVKNYDPNQLQKDTQTPEEVTMSSEEKIDDLPLDSSSEEENIEEFTPFHSENVETPHFLPVFEVAKYNVLEKEEEGCLRIALLELRCAQEPTEAAFAVFSVLLGPGPKAEKHSFVKKTAADASQCYENCIKKLRQEGFLLMARVRPEATQFGSEQLQALLLEEEISSSTLSPEVSDLVEMIWTEALGHLEHVLLRSANTISLNDVNKAEGILLLAKTALKNGETQEQLQKIMTEFNRLIPKKDATAKEVNLKTIAKDEDLCQLIRDMVNVCETNLFKPNPPSLAKYRALRCKIKQVDQNTEEFISIKKELLQNYHSVDPVNILQMFRVGRVDETMEFQSQLGNVETLLHGSAAHSFVGILSRGLLLPKVVEDRGVKRTDIGNLGSGIYFSNSLSTSIKYSCPGETEGSRLLVICDVALGKCMDLEKRDFSLTKAPPGYDSVHGVAGPATDFEDDEFVVYNTNQIKMKYIIKFYVPGDEIKNFCPCNETELEEFETESPCFSVKDYQLPDTKSDSSIKAGLQDTSGNLVPLEDVCIKGKIIDFIAQVVVFQTYSNQSHVPIEAKYIFPLEDKAAVCGFEAFINGKHIVGEIKEKEEAHQEYREAISQGHGAYLMDQDSADIFTVSIGNLPPKGKVLIKITYITELSIQGTAALFFIPASVAPWQQDKALNENIQDTVKKICVKEIGTEQSFSLTMSIEMPYVIDFISSDTHELKQKRTDCTAVVSTMESSRLDSSGFCLRVGLTDAYLPRMWVEKHPEKESEACMLVFQPKLDVALRGLVKQSEVIICLDCSNSMESAVFLEAKQIALYALSLVGKKPKVNIIKFGTDYEELFPYPTYIKNKIEATEFIMTARPAMGNTDFWKVLRYLNLLYPSRGFRNILLVSDGHLQNEGLTLRLVKKSVRHTRLFSCGVGSTANRHTLRILSQCGAGVFEYFNSKSKHSWKKQIEAQITRFYSPSCHSVSIRWQQLSTCAPEPLQAPAQVQSLFHNERLLVYGFIPHCTQACLCALIQEKEFSAMVSTTELQKTKGTMIHKLTARALIRDYEDGILHEDETNHQMKKQKLKSLIIKLSKENTLITQFTSFVAVEKRDSDESSPNTPNIMTLIAEEDVDCLPYMSWQEEQPQSCLLEVGDLVLEDQGLLNDTASDRSKEGIDLDMLYQEEQSGARVIEGVIAKQPRSLSFEWSEDSQYQSSTKRKCLSSKLEVPECYKLIKLVDQESQRLDSELGGVDKALDLSQVDSLKALGLKRRPKEATAMPPSPSFLKDLVDAACVPFCPVPAAQALHFDSPIPSPSVLFSISPTLSHLGLPPSPPLLSSPTPQQLGPCPTAPLCLDSVSDSPIPSPSPPLFSSPTPQQLGSRHISPVCLNSVSDSPSPPPAFLCSSLALPQLDPPPSPPLFSSPTPQQLDPLPALQLFSFSMLQQLGPPPAAPLFSSPTPPQLNAPSAPLHVSPPGLPEHTGYPPAPPFSSPVPLRQVCPPAPPLFSSPVPPQLDASPIPRLPSYSPSMVPSFTGAQAFSAPYGALAPVPLAGFAGTASQYGPLKSASVAPHLPSSPSFADGPGAGPHGTSLPLVLLDGAPSSQGQGTGTSTELHHRLDSSSGLFGSTKGSAVKTNLKHVQRQEALPMWPAPPEVPAAHTLPFGSPLHCGSLPGSSATLSSLGSVLLEDSSDSCHLGISPSRQPPDPPSSDSQQMSGQTDSKTVPDSLQHDLLTATNKKSHMETEIDGAQSRHLFSKKRKSRKPDRFSFFFQINKNQEHMSHTLKKGKNFLPWTELFNLQTEDGFWKLTSELGDLLGLNISILSSFLDKKGIRSLGVKGRECLLDLIATFLVLQFLCLTMEQEGINSLMKLNDASLFGHIPWAFKKIKKASEWVRKTEGQYPGICQRLELGKDWDLATKQLLGSNP